MPKRQMLDKIHVLLLVWVQKNHLNLQNLKQLQEVLSKVARMIPIEEHKAETEKLDKWTNDNRS